MFQTKILAIYYKLCCKLQIVKLPWIHVVSWGLQLEPCFYLLFCKLAPWKVCRISYQEFLFAKYLGMHQQLPLDYFNTAGNLKTWWFSGKFWPRKENIFGRISKQINGCLSAMDMGHDTVLWVEVTLNLKICWSVFVWRILQQLGCWGF